MNRRLLGGQQTLFFSLYYIRKPFRYTALKIDFSLYRSALIYSSILFFALFTNVFVSTLIVLYTLLIVMSHLYNFCHLHYFRSYVSLLIFLLAFGLSSICFYINSHVFLWYSSPPYIKSSAFRLSFPWDFPFFACLYYFFHCSFIHLICFIHFYIFVKCRPHLPEFLKILFPYLLNFCCIRHDVSSFILDMYFPILTSAFLTYFLIKFLLNFGLLFYIDFLSFHLINYPIYTPVFLFLSKNTCRFLFHLSLCSTPHCTSHFHSCVILCSSALSLSIQYIL